jgi:acetoin utilization protein AcuC
MLPRFIGSDIYQLPVFKPPHPLAVPRVMLAADLCAAMGWLVDAQYEDSPVAGIAELCRFHTPDYIAALVQAEANQDLPAQQRQTYRIGADANIIHPAVFRRPATSAGGALLAAQLTARGGIVHAPGVGNHHGRPARASGFCFVNDIALGFLRWRELGVRRIAYLDLDAHHGDGVEDAFADDPDVLTISVHEAGRWPRTGLSCDPARAIRNLAVPPAFNDSELSLLLHEKILPAIVDFRPDAIFLLPGADALADDPMAKLALTNNAIWEAARAVKGIAPRLVVGGGGGYNPYALARCWAGVWAVLNDFPIPDSLPPSALDVLGRVEYFRAAGRNPPAHWVNALRDPSAPGDVRDEIKAMIW